MIEVVWHGFDDEYGVWFDVGLSMMATPHHPDKRYLFSIALFVVSIYIRFGDHKK